MKDDELRATFEAHFSQPPFEWSMTRQHEHDAWPGNYRHYAVHCAWEAWQACHATMQGEDVRRDADRLDWMDANAFTAYRGCDSIDGLSSHCVVVHEKPGPRRGNVADTIRQAIDTAMGERHG